MSKYQPYPSYKDSGVEWLGQVPEHWVSKQLIRTVSGNTNGIWGQEPKNDGSDTVVLRVADFDRSKLSLKEHDFTERQISNSELTNRRLQKGDLLLEKSGGGEKTLVGQVVLFDKEFEAVTSNFVAKMTPLNGHLSTYLNYVFSHFYSTNINYCSIKQNTGIQNIDADSYLRESFSFPSIDEQTQITNFLDKETSKMDLLIEKQQTMIALLKEKRQAVISHAVTKGIPNQNRPNTPMKDSGIKWLGQIPEHWAIPKMFYLTTRIGDGLHSTPKYQDSTGYFFINGNNLILGKIKIFPGTKEVPEEEFYNHYIELNNSTVLLSINGTIGNTALYFNENVILGKSAAYINCKPKLNREFLRFYLTSSEALTYYGLEVTGTTIFNLSLNSIRKMPVSLPSQKEQIEIANYCKEQLSKFNNLIDKSQQAIALLKERKTALISAAVTGKIDVRGVA